MILGVVNAAYEAVITLSVQSPEGQAQQVDAVVDTGFTGFLTLPPALMTELALPFRDYRPRDPGRRQRGVLRYLPGYGAVGRPAKIRAGGRSGHHPACGYAVLGHA